MDFLKRLAQSTWFWRIAGGFGCLFLLTWVVLCLVLLVDVAATGAAEWGPWTAEELASPGEYIAGYVVATVLGLVCLIFLVRWTWPFLTKQ